MHFALDVALIYELSFFSFYAASKGLPEFEGDKQKPHPFEALAIGYWAVRVFPLSITPAEVALLLINANTLRSFYIFVLLLVFVEAIHLFLRLPFQSLYVAWRRFTIFSIFWISGLAVVHISWSVFQLHKMRESRYDGRIFS